MPDTTFTFDEAQEEKAPETFSWDDANTPAIPQPTAPPQTGEQRAAQNWQGLLGIQKQFPGFKPSLAGTGPLPPTTTLPGGMQVTEQGPMQIPRLTAPPQAGALEQGATGAFNVAASIPNFMLSKEGMGTMLAPEVLPAKFAAPALKGLFMGLMAKAAGQQAGEFSVHPTVQSGTEAALTALGVPLIAAAPTGETEYARNVKTPNALHANVRPQPGEGQGQVPVQEGGRGILAPTQKEKANLALTEALSNNLSLGIGHQLEELPDFGPTDPDHLRVFKALPPTEQGQPGKILMSRTAFDKWIDTVPEDQRPEAVKAAVAEEGIHSTVKPEEAIAYLNTLSPAEIAIGQKLYLGPHAAADVGLTKTQLGHELLRQRMQRVLRMKPTELAEVAGREKWSRASLEFIGNLIRRLRELVGRRPAKAGQRMVSDLLDRYQENLASLEPTEGELAGAALGGEQPFMIRRSPEQEAQHKEDMTFARRVIDMSPDQFFKEGQAFNRINLRLGRNASPEDVAELKKLQVRAVDRATEAQKKSEASPGDDELLQDYISVAMMPQFYNEAIAQAEKSPAMIRRNKEKGQKELFLPSVSSENVPHGTIERPTAEQLGAPPAAPKVSTGLALHQQAYSFIQQATDALERGQEGAKAPTFAQFAASARKANPGTQPGALAETWDRAVGIRLQNASGTALKALANELGIKSPERIADPPSRQAQAAQAQQEKTVRPGQAIQLPGLKAQMGDMRQQLREARAGQLAAQRQRQRVSAAIFERLVEPAYPDTALSRKSVSPEDLGYNLDSKEPVVWDVTAADLKNPVSLAGRLTQDARRRPTDKVSATRRLTLLRDEKTGKAYLVDTYRHGRTGAMLVDPRVAGVRNHRPLSDILKSFRPVASYLLDEPVQNFSQSFKSLADFEAKFGTDARRAVHPLYESPLKEGETRTPGSRQVGGPLTDVEARAAYNHLRSKTGAAFDPQKAIEKLRQYVKVTSPAHLDYQVINAYHKMFEAVRRKWPELPPETQYELFKDELHNLAASSPNEGAFTRYALRKYSGLVSERAPGVAKKPAPAAAAAGAQAAARIQRALGVKELQDAPAMLRRTREAISEETKALTEDVINLVKGHRTELEITRTLDKADNTSNNRSRAAETGIRILSAVKPPGAIKAFIQNWRRGDQNVLSAANVLVEAEAVRASGTVDLGRLKAAIPEFKALVADGRKKAEAMIAAGGYRNRKVGQAWLRAADQLDRELDYADAHATDQDLRQTAVRMKQELEAQYTKEKSKGYELTKDPNYLPHRYDAQLWDGHSVLFQSVRILGKKFREKKRFDTHYHAIAEGPYIPATRDGASLVGHRLRQGDMMINRDAWAEGLKGITAPDGKPVAIEPIRLSMSKWGSPHTSYKLITQGGRKPLVIHDDFDKLVKNLTSASVVQDYMLSRGALNFSQQLKHTLLIGDFFHLGRVVYYGTSIMGRRTGWRGGWSVLDINERDLPEAVKRGVISERDANWGKEKVQYGSSAITRRDLAQLFQDRGLNVGKIQDALYKDLVTHLTPSSGPMRKAFVRMLDPTVGRYNRFLFDKLSRGLMLESSVREFERQSKAMPGVNPKLLVDDISKDVNTFFGNIGRQGWFKGGTAQDVARLLWLAPQWVEGLIKKEAGAYTRWAGTAAKAAGAPYREGLSGMGTLGQGMARGLATMFLLTQAINLYTRKKPTWENEEKGHMWDAYIPGFGADESGFWLSPLGLFNEISHDVYRLVQDKPKFFDAINQIAGNKESPLIRAILVARTGRSPTGTYLSSSGGQLANAFEQLAPAPITFSRYVRAAGHAMAPGVVDPNLPGQLQRQSYGTFGFKLEPKKNALQEVQEMARKFADEKGHKETIHIEETDEPSYSRLRQAVRNDDPHGAWKMLGKLRAQGKTDEQILKAMRIWSQRNFTWSHDAEEEFRYSLTPEQREVLSDAQFQRQKEYQRFIDFYQQEPK